MKKALILLWVNVLLIIAFVGQLATVVFHDQIPRKVFGAVHIPLGWILLTLGILHLILNWSWVKNSFASLLKSRS